MDLESRAVSARVTKHFVTIFSKTCNNKFKTVIPTVQLLGHVRLIPQNWLIPHTLLKTTFN